MAENKETTESAASTLKNVCDDPPDIVAPPGAAFTPLERALPNPGRRLEHGLRTRGMHKRSRPGKPLISVVTAVLNGREHLERTIKSVLGQTYDNVEYIVIDGGSTDGTLEIIEKYAHALDYCVSEPDKGISDSFNKGLALARGDMIGIISSDDWFEPEALELAASNYERTPCFSFSGCRYIKSSGQSFVLPPDPDYGRKIRYWMPKIHHPTVFVKREAYEKHGLFDGRWRYSMDYELLLRFHSRGCTGLAIPGVTANMGMGGASNRNYFAVKNEVRRISMRYGASFFTAGALYLLFIIKYLLNKKN